MADTLTVASRVHTDVVIHEPIPAEFKDQPGLAPQLRSIVINGGRHPDAVNDVGITKGVDAALFRQWLDANKAAPMVAAGLVYELKDDVASVEFGHEPALERLATEPDAGGGSTVTGPAPVSAEAMAATSDTPNDDSPRSQTRGA